MCFLEFIGYTCGHASLPVLRPCPLTTASHTFPTCAHRADKPFLAGEMCAACQKIVHSRATQIEEYEHRFMHERGVCGCATVFPYLIRPRVIGREEMGSDSEENTREEKTSDSEEKTASDSEETKKEDKTSDSEKTETKTIPVMKEVTDDAGRAVVSVRLPSLFAAEWVADHRTRHEDGLCQCHVDFRTYQEVVADDSIDSIDSVVLLVPQRSASVPLESASESASDYGSNESDDDDHDDAPKIKRPSTAPNGSTPRGGEALRAAGAIFENVPTYLPLTGPFLAQPASPALARVADGQLPPGSNTPPRPAAETAPLVGFPLGAGPEGVSHAVPWRENPACRDGKTK